MLIQSRRGHSRDDSGFAIVMTMVIALVATALAASVVMTVNSGLKESRRAGDSANALQVADAGINAAVKRLENHTTADPLVIDETLSGTGDRYRVTATQESQGKWRVDAMGFDGTGQRRRVRADAVSGALFEFAIFTKTTMAFASGVAVDSFTSGLTQAATCNRKGYVGTNEPENNDMNVQGQGNGVRNCTANLPPGNPTPNVYDACIGYGDSEPVAPFQDEADNATNHACGFIAYRTPKLEIPNIDTSGVPLTADTLNCTGPLNLAPGKYRYNSITLRNGCVIPSSAATAENPVEIYTSGSVTIGSTTNGLVNPPPANCANTSSTGNDLYGGIEQSPLRYYCAGWAGRFRLNVAGPGTVNFAQHQRFWGVIHAPQRALDSGNHAIMWGAVTANSLTSASHLVVHYDESLGGLTNGKYTIQVWREEPLQ